MYQALYRKWRPKTFDEVVGQEHITETLKSQVRNGRLSHAYLFIGTRGTGKTTCARILARAVNCEHPEDGNPCGHCAACRGILEGSVMDVVELDAASNNGVDNVRALREEAVFSPAEVKKRVYIIDEVHMLSTAAFNALLKILEEPPEHLMFILATTELQKVPATILSRCQRHSFRRLEAETISRYLLTIAGREQMNLEPDAADLIARLADGGVRDALSLLDQCAVNPRIDRDAVYQTVGLAGKKRIGELLDGILEHNSGKVLQLFASLWMEGKDPASVLTELSSLLRDIMILSVAPKAGLNLLSGGYDAKTLQQFSPRISAEEAVSAMETIQRTLGGMKDVKNPRTAAELCLVSLCCDAAGDSVDHLRARISRLEEQMERGVVPQTSVSRISQMEREDMLPEESAEAELYEAPELPEEEAPQPESAAETAEPAQPDEELWPKIRSAVLPAVPMDVRISLEDEGRIRGYVEGNLLILEPENAFLLARFQKQDVIQRMAEAARSVTGRELRVQVRERKPEERQTRSLDELKQFKEVHFK